MNALHWWFNQLAIEHKTDSSTDVNLGSYTPEMGWHERFDVLFVFEILEHIGDDLGALKSWPYGGCS